MKLSEYSELIATEVDTKGSNPRIASGCNGDVAAPAPVCGEGVLPVRTISALTERGVPDHELRIKAGSICLLMRNLSVRKGLVENARVVIQGLYRRFVKIRVINNRTGCLGIRRVHLIPRILSSSSTLETIL